MRLTSRESSIVGSSQDFDRLKLSRGKYYSRLRLYIIAWLLGFYYRTSLALPAVVSYAGCRY
jgi:hypothetical protein